MEFEAPSKISLIRKAVVKQQYQIQLKDIRTIIIEYLLYLLKLNVNKVIINK